MNVRNNDKIYIIRISSTFSIATTTFVYHQSYIQEYGAFRFIRKMKELNSN